MPRPSASPALRVLRTLRTGSRMTLRRHKDFLALAGALQKIAGYRGLLAVRASPFPWLAANDKALQPYLDKKITVKRAIAVAEQPFRQFMMSQTRTNDLDVFASLAGYKEIKDYKALPLTILIPAFVTSELKTAFQIGFLLFIPFLIIDLVVASTLMSMGMMMLSPLIISLPFKVMLFVLVDGWTLVIGTLANSFGAGS